MLINYQFLHLMNNQIERLQTKHFKHQNMKDGYINKVINIKHGTKDGLC